MHTSLGEINVAKERQLLHGSLNVSGKSDDNHRRNETTKTTPLRFLEDATCGIPRAVRRWTVWRLFRVTSPVGALEACGTSQAVKRGKP